MFRSIYLSFFVIFLWASINALQAAPPNDYIKVFSPYTEPQSDGSDLTVSTFTPSGVIDGNVKLEAGVLHINQGKTVQINGHLIHSGGDLEVNSDSKLIVTGDYRIQTPSDSGYTYSDGVFKVGGRYSRLDPDWINVQVQGDFVIDSTRKSIKPPSLEVRGDNANNTREMLLTSLETLETRVVGETANDPIRYLSSNWSGVTATAGFRLNQLNGKC